MARRHSVRAIAAASGVWWTVALEVASGGVGVDIELSFSWELVV